MNKKYSIIKIINNKIGNPLIIYLIILLIIIIFSLIFLNNQFIKIKLLFISTTFLIGILVFLFINIKKIDYFFKHGIETKALVTNENYLVPMKYSIIAKTLVRWNGGDEKTGVQYRYEIGSKFYENSYRYLINENTKTIKQSSIVDILVNPKNKNDTIIKDIFVKT